MNPRRHDKTYAFKGPNRVIYPCGIVKRRCKVIFYWHFGILCIDEYNNYWVIENNIDGIKYITLHNFLAGRKKFYTESIPKGITKDEILNRVKERASIPYIKHKNNCENFVNYAVYGKDYSRQTIITEAIVDMLGSIFEGYMIHKANKKGAHQLKTNFDKLRNLFDFPRNENYELLINNILKQKMNKNHKKPKGIN